MDKNIKHVMTFVAVVVFAGLVGSCNASYLPWVQNPWPNRVDEQERALRAAPPQVTLEDYCRDMRETIELYRTYLDPDFDWAARNITPSAAERRREYLRRLVEEYDQMCSEAE